jgi:hypothetical protein
VTLLVERLKAAGFRARLGRRTKADEIFRAGREVFIDEVKVSAFEYPSENAVASFVAATRPRGDIILSPTGELVVVQWGDHPHWFDEGRLVVLYVGDKQRTLEALELVLGPQFAGL